MTHEASSTSGTLVNEEQNAAVGWISHKSLSSASTCVSNTTGDIWLVFTGNDYSRGATQIKYLVERYERLGSGFFASLNGIFSGVILDSRNRKIILFNDRYGLDRIYYCEHEGTFYFASEAKALLRILPELRSLNMTSLGEFFACGCVLQNRSLFSGVYLLPPASEWIFEPHQSATKETYFEFGDWENRPTISTTEYYRQLKETFTDVLPRYLHGPESIALSLTGGLDSRMILACANPEPFTLPCYTFGGMYRQCADVCLAKRLAHVSRQQHETISVTPRFFAEFPELARQSVYYTDGAMDVTGSVELFANRIARTIAPVRLTGNYGSEILRRNVAFKPNPLCNDVFDPGFSSFIQKAAATYIQEKQGSLNSFIAFKQVPWHHFGRLSIERSQLTVRSPFLDNDLVNLAYQAPTEASVNKSLTGRLIADSNPELATIPTDRGPIRKRNGQFSGLRAFWQEFMPRAEYAYDYGMPQWLAKVDHIFAFMHAERLFLGRQKFSHFRIWYRDHLSEYVKAILLDSRTLSRPYLQGREVERIVLGHTKGTGNFTSEIHKLLTSELIQRVLIEQNL